MENIDESDYLNEYNKKEEKELDIEDVVEQLFIGNLNIVDDLDGEFIEENYPSLVQAIKDSTSNPYNKQCAIQTLKNKIDIAHQSLPNQSSQIL